MYTGVGEANEARHDRATWPCASTRPSNTGVGQMSNAPKFKNRETHRKKLGHTSMSHGHVQCCPHVLRRPLFPPQKTGKEQRHPQVLPRRLGTRSSRFPWDPEGIISDITGPTPSLSKASALSPSLRYLHAILAHNLTGRRESTGVITTHDTYFLWSIANGHIIVLAYFIALDIRHQTDRHRKWAPQHSSTIILPHSHWPDVPIGHLEHAKYEDDRETMWHISSSVPPRLVHRGGGPRGHY
ncbi:hypothetical protein GOBAR_AA07727 [Gossypium barbadense]|uniref:Uncharacterized protein n=1 Tax=Gossypium barbadense TaxID=3634 RepID=A0A2P5YBG7_GOSBA|nr:hypothetical protein GOBAR_AA07727 [Gossypium barbadense]